MKTASSTLKPGNELQQSKARQINRANPVPLYFQIAERLRESIRHDQLQPGDLLITDERLQAEFEVSRATARKAIDELVDEGLVQRITGKGTFVVEPRLQVPLPAMLSFTEELERRGMRPSTTVIEAKWTRATPAVAHALDLPRDQRVLRLERIRYADREPVLHTLDYLPDDIGIVPNDNFTASLYQLIEERGVVLTQCQNIIRAAATGARLSKMLSVRVGFPVLALERTSYDSSGRPVLYEEASCRSDRYSYAVRLWREPLNDQS